MLIADSAIYELLRTIPQCRSRPGTYWIDGWVNRPELTGLQWYWDMTNAGNPIDSEFYIQNPGGKFPTPSLPSSLPCSWILMAILWH